MPLTTYRGREWDAAEEKARRLEWAETEEMAGHFLTADEWAYVRMEGAFADDWNYRYFETEPDGVIARRPLAR